MAVNKNFVVRNGLEVADNLIFTDTVNSRVGFGTTSIDYTVHVIGGIGATDAKITGFTTTNSLTVFSESNLSSVTANGIGVTNLSVSGVGTFAKSITTGVSTAGNLSVGTAGTTITTHTGGKVGIGTTNALHRFQVGSANTTGFTTTTSGLFVVTHSGRVGIQTGQPGMELHVFGDQTVTGVITATTFNGQINSGVGTITRISATHFNSTNANIGVATVGFLTGTNLYYTGISTLANVVIGSGTTDLVVSGDARITGILTIGTSSITLNGNTNTVNVGTGFTLTGNGHITAGNITAGIVTANEFYGSIQGNLISNTIDSDNAFINVGIVTYATGTNLNYSGIGSIGTLDTTVGTIDYLSGVNLNYSGIGTISNIKIQNGQIQAVSGIATYYGDGSNLAGVTYGVGIRSDDGVIAGSGVTILNFTGSGISTVTAALGIATIFVEGGGAVVPTQIQVTDDTSSATTHYLTFTSGAGTNQDLKIDTSLLSYVPSTNTLRASTFIGDLTGTATTATNATNINISATTSTDTTTSVVLVGNQATGNQSPFIDSGLTYNANTNNLTATTFTGALSGNATSATTATNATNTTITDTTTSASTHYITFVDGTSGNRAQRVDSTGLTYIPDTNVINASISGNAATVTTNANLTGDVTSVGNATAIASGVIVNDDISASAAIAVSKLAASTISGVTLGSNLATLTRGTYLTGSNYNGSVARTWAVDATTTNTASKVVARDASGDFAANVITCVDINSTSDLNLKSDIRPFEDALATVNQLNGVHFTWKKDDRKSVGVIAQEIEAILPELVTEVEGHKTVNYNGLIGVLIEAVKELNEKVKTLEGKLY